MSWLPPFSRAGHRARPLPADPLQLGPGQRARQHAVLQRRQRQRRHPVRVRVDQRLLPPVPLGQQVGRGGGAEQAGVGDPGVADPGDVPRRRVLAVEVPDRLVGVREVVGEEPAAVRLGEDPGVAPALPGRVAVLLRRLAGAQVEDVDHEQVARLRALDLDRAAEHVRHAEVHVAHIVGRVVVAQLGVGPLPALDPELRAGADRRRGAGCRDATGCVPAPPGPASTWTGPR